jgi:hypothetical protein
MNCAKPVCLAAMVAVLLVFSTLHAYAVFQPIDNDTWLKDQNGNPLYAQGGGISEFGGTYYMFGVEYDGAPTYYQTGTSNSDTTFDCINLYTSTDLVHWTWKDIAVASATLPGNTWVGRLGSVFYNSNIQKYVMWCEYWGTDAPNGGMACLTSSSLTGKFSLANVQTSIGNVYHTIPGDSTVFCDVDHGNTPYLIFSDPHGRQRAYVSTFSSNGESINPATQVYLWPQGQEADCMFYLGGYYHYVTSQLAGWSYSSAYEVHSTNILSGYSSDAFFNGTTQTNTYYSQISYFVDVHGSSVETIVGVGDRWADFDSSYKNAGHGENYLIFCPISLSGSSATFNALGTWDLDAVTGEWEG